VSAPIQALIAQSLRCRLLRFLDSISHNCRLRLVSLHRGWRRGMEKRGLSELDICTKFITPALRQAGWDEMLQIREEVSFTKGRIIVRGKLVTRGQAKRADYILYYKPNIPLALI